MSGRTFPNFAIGRALTALVSVAVLATACASGGIGGDETVAGGAETEQRTGYATLVIENDSPSAVTLYALRNGSRQRIATLPGLTTERIPIQRTILAPGGELRVGVDPIGSSRFYTGHPILVREGDVVEMTVSSFVR